MQEVLTLAKPRSKRFRAEIINSASATPKLSVNVPHEGLDDDADDPEIEDNIIPTPAGQRRSGQSRIPNRHYEGWWNHDADEDVNDVGDCGGAEEDDGICSHGSEYEESDD